MTAIGKSLPLLLALGALLAALTWLPPLSDGDLAVFDGITYAHHVEQAADPSTDATAVVTHPNHLLHHVLAWVLVDPLRALGCGRPGYVAGRLLAGLGAAALVLLVARLAGRGRGAVGAAFALAPLVSRGVLLDAGSGETVLPGAAAALGALVLACRRPVPLKTLGAVLVLALLLRQDNVLVVPALLAAVAAGRAPGRRLAAAVGLAGGAGLVTLALYALAWRLGPSQAGFLEYLLGIGTEGSWSFLASVDVPASRLHLGAFAWALVGRTGDLDDPQLAVSLLYVAGLLAAGRLVGGGRLRDPFVGAVLLVLAARVPFFLWFEPEHWEWQVLPLVLVAATGARLAAGGADVPPWRRRAGVVLALVVSVGLLASHGAHTWSLRRSTLEQAVAEALARAGPGAEVHVIGLRAAMVLYVRDVPHLQLDAEHHPSLPFPPGLEASVRAFLGRARERSEPTLLVVDRFVRDGMPATRRLEERYDVLAALAAGRDVAVLRRDGAPYALLAPPPGS